MAEERAHRRRWLKRSLWIGLALVLLASVALAMRTPPAQVDLTTARRGRFVLTIDEAGKTRVKDRYLVSAPLTGTVLRPELHPGDKVAQGQVLARIVPLLPPLLDPRTRASAVARVAAAEAGLLQARAQVERVRTAGEHAALTLARQQGLLQRGVATKESVESAELAAKSSREELSSAEFSARVAAHELEVARAALGRMSGPARGEELTLTAPVAGVVLRVLQESEGVVQPGSPLYELGDPRALEIVVPVLTADAVAIPPRAAVSIERWGGASRLEAHVRLVEPAAFTRLSALGVEEQRVNVLIDLDEPYERWAALGDGFRVEARLVLADREGIMIIPPSAGFKDGEHWAVYRVREGRAELARFELGQTSDRALEVLSGLAEGDEIVLYPSDRLTPGARVTPRQGQSESREAASTSKATP